MPEFTLLAILSVVAVVAAELLWLRSGIFGKPTFWIAYGIILFFEVLVDGWLTKLSAPIVIYDPDQFSGWRFPWDIPVEDFLFGFSFIVLTLILWDRAGDRRDRRSLGRGRREGAGG